MIPWFNLKKASLGVELWSFYCKERMLVPMSYIAVGNKAANPHVFQAQIIPKSSPSSPNHIKTIPKSSNKSSLNHPQSEPSFDLKPKINFCSLGLKPMPKDASRRKLSKAGCSARKSTFCVGIGQFYCRVGISAPKSILVFHWLLGIPQRLLGIPQRFLGIP